MPTASPCQVRGGGGDYAIVTKENDIRDTRTHTHTCPFTQSLKCSACTALFCEFAHKVCMYLTAVLSEVEDKTQNGFHQPVDDKLGGLLQTSFIVSYMLLSPLFGYLGDRWTRKYIVGVGIMVWSAFTLISSFSVVSGMGREGGREER